VEETEAKLAQLEATNLQTEAKLQATMAELETTSSQLEETARFAATKAFLEAKLAQLEATNSQTEAKLQATMAELEATNSQLKTESFAARLWQEHARASTKAFLSVDTPPGGFGIGLQMAQAQSLKSSKYLRCWLSIVDM
jgi:hypothetical protein